MDAWEKGEETRESVTCSLVFAIGFLDRYAVAFKELGAQVPPVIADAAELVGALGSCKELAP